MSRTTLHIITAVLIGIAIVGSLVAMWYAGQAHRHAKRAAASAEKSRRIRSGAARSDGGGQR